MLNCNAKIMRFKIGSGNTRREKLGPEPGLNEVLGNFSADSKALQFIILMQESS